MHRRRWAGAVGLLLSGCGASDPGYEVIYGGNTTSNATDSAGRQDLPRASVSSVEAPRATFAAMQLCADRFAPKLRGESFGVMYDVNVGANGNIVKVKDSMLDGSPLEHCLATALEQMDTSVAIHFQPDVPLQSRGMVGIVQAAAAPIALLPIVLVAGGATILVGVTIYVGAEVIDAAKRRRPKGGNRCLDAAAAGGEMWRKLCRSVPDPIVRAGCWGLAERNSEEEKRNWCNAYEGFW